MKNSRPVIKIKPEPVDRVLDFIAMVAVTGLIVFPIWYYPQLPDVIPTHFGVNGMPDAYGDKNNLWWLPAIGVILYIGLKILTNYPHIFNYPVIVTPENAEKLYRSGTRLVRFVNATTSVVFLYISYHSIQVAMGQASGLGSYLLIAIIILFTLPIVYFIVRMVRNK